MDLRLWHEVHGWVRAECHHDDSTRFFNAAWKFLNDPPMILISAFDQLHWAVLRLSASSLVLRHKLSLQEWGEEDRRVRWNWASPEVPELIVQTNNNHVDNLGDEFCEIGEILSKLSTEYRRFLVCCHSGRFKSTCVVIQIHYDLQKCLNRPCPMNDLTRSPNDIWSAASIIIAGIITDRLQSAIETRPPYLLWEIV